MTPVEVQSFMLLEERRREDVARTRSPVKRRDFSRLRTRGLERRLAREAHAATAPSAAT